MGIIPLAVFFAALAFLGRHCLVLFGWLKGPILRECEKYGGDEAYYLALLPLLLWGGVFTITLGAWLSAFVGLSFPLTGLGVAMILAALAGYNSPTVAARWHRLVRLPRWYHELLDRTDRYERRRIAYMWLRLPWRARLAYNGDDRAFFVWVDLIVMGTVLDEEDPALTPGRG